MTEAALRSARPGQRRRGKRRSAAARWDALPVEGDLRSGKEASFVNLRLVAAATGGQAWSTRFDLPQFDNVFESSAPDAESWRRAGGCRQERRDPARSAQPIENVDAMGLVLRGYAVWKTGRR